MLDQLKNPPIQYRIAPVWTWSRLPEPDDIDTQIREMHHKGAGGFFVEDKVPRSQHTDDDVSLRVRQAREVAERLGMQVYEADQQTSFAEPDSTLAAKMRSSQCHAENKVRVPGIVRCASWETAIEDIKRQIDHQASLGASLFVPYPFEHTIVGASPVRAAASQFYQATYWRYYKAISDYAARLSYLMSLGHHAAQAVVIRPGGCRDGLAPDLEQWLQAICDCLLAQHVDFDILDEDALSRATCTENRLVLNDESYELVIVPPAASIAYGTASKLCAFAEEEGKVIAIAPFPGEDSRGDRHAGVREAFAVIREVVGELFLDISRPGDLPVALGQALRAAIKPDISIKRGGEECADITCTHRRVDELDLFFLANHAEEAREVRISVRCDRAPLLVSLDSGDITALPNCTQQGNRTVLLHRMEKSGSLVMAFGDEPVWSVIPQSIDEGQEIGLSDEWVFTPEQPNCLGLPEWSFNTLIQANHELYEYTTSFEAGIVPENLMLVLEDQPGFGPDAGRSIEINGTELAVQDAWVYDIGLRAFDIASLARSGVNTVRMTVARQGWTGDPVPSPARARLMGDFAIDAARPVLREQQDTIRNGSWTDQGYPFYSGTACYEQVLYVPEFARGQRIIVRADGVAGAVEFLLNGAIASVRCWAPYEADITALAKPGPNTLELRVTNSLANALLLQPIPSGLIHGAVALLA